MNLNRTFLVLMLATGIACPAFAQEQMALNLEESILLALEHNRTLAASHQKLEEARAKVGEARTGFLPKFSGSASYVRLDVAPFMPGKVFESISGNIPGMPSQEFPKRIPMGRDEMVDIGVSLQQPLFTGFQVWNAYGMAVDGFKATEASYDQDREDLILQVKEAYWGALKAEKVVEVAEGTVEQMKSHVQDLQNMYDVGMLTKNDLLKAKVQLSNVRLIEIQAKNGRKLANQALCNLMGVPLETEIQLIEELTTVLPEKVELEEAVQLALSQRPEVRMMDHNVHLGEKAVAIASAGWLPSVAFVLDYGYSKPDREYNPDFYTTWTASVVAQMNLFDWGETHYKTQQAKRQLSQMEETFAALKEGIALEVTQASLLLKEAEEMIEIAKDNVAQAEENYRVTHDKFKEGMVTNTEVLDANSLLLKAKTDYISALADYRVAQAQMDRASGRRMGALNED